MDFINPNLLTVSIFGLGATMILALALRYALDKSVFVQSGKATRICKAVIYISILVMIMAIGFPTYLASTVYVCGLIAWFATIFHLAGQGIQNS